MKIGSLCTGYGGLDMAVEAFFNAEMVWCAIGLCTPISTLVRSMNAKHLVKILPNGQAGKTLMINTKPI